MDVITTTGLPAALGAEVVRLSHHAATSCFIASEAC